MPLILILLAAATAIGRTRRRAHPAAPAPYIHSGYDALRFTNQGRLRRTVRYGRAGRSGFSSSTPTRKASSARTSCSRAPAGPRARAAGTTVSSSGRIILPPWTRQGRQNQPGRVHEARPIRKSRAATRTRTAGRNTDEWAGGPPQGCAARRRTRQVVGSADEPSFRAGFPPRHRWMWRGRRFRIRCVAP